MTISATMWDAKVGDTGPAISAQLRERPAPGKRYGEPVPLTDITAITVFCRRESDLALLHTGPVNVVDGTKGEIWAALAPAVTAQAGLVAVEFVVTMTDSSTRTWPAEALADYWYLRVRADLGSTAAPTSVATGLPVGPLFVAAGQTATVTFNGQQVFAAPNSTIRVAAGVNYFGISEWQGHGTWTLSTLPTITPTAGVLHSTVQGNLLTSAGDSVTLALDPAGSTWYGTRPTGGGSGTGAQEVGEGSVLPADGTVWELFRLIGSANPARPDGLWYYNTVSGTGGAWVSVGSGASGLSYTHTQTVAATTWTITHNLGYNPAGIVISDQAGSEVTPDNIDYPNTSTVVVSFLAPQAGTARLS